MSKRHTLGVSKWLPSTEDKITFEITLRPCNVNVNVMYLTHGSIIFDILESHAFKKYSTCRVF